MTNEQQKKIDENLYLTACYKDIFLRTDAGQAILKDLSRVCHEGQNAYVKGSFDGTAFNCGSLSIIQYIRSRLNAKDEPRQTDAQNEGTD